MTARSEHDLFGRHELNICSVLLAFDSSIQSPVLGESVSMYSPSDDNPNFYKDLMVKSHDGLFCLFHYWHFSSVWRSSSKSFFYLQFHLLPPGGDGGSLVTASRDCNSAAEHKTFIQMCLIKEERKDGQMWWRTD